MVVYGGELVSLITIHGGALLFDVNDLLDFTSVSGGSGGRVG